MTLLNGDAPVRYRISQGDQRWVVKLSAPDDDASKLTRWIRDNEISGKLEVVVEFRVAGEWRTVGPFPIDADTLR